MTDDREARVDQQNPDGRWSPAELASLSATRAKYRLSADGLTLSYSADLPEGALNGTVTWGDLDTALAHYEAAIEATEQRLARIVQVDERRSARRLTGPFGGKWFLGTSVGPPTWWWPSIRTGKDDTGWYLKAGWLRAAFGLHQDLASLNDQNDR